MRRSVVLLLCFGVLWGCGDDVGVGDATVDDASLNDADLSVPDVSVEDATPDVELDDAMVDAELPAEFTDIPGRELAVDQSDPERRQFEYEMEDLDPNATSQPREYFRRTEVLAMIDTRAEMRGELMVWFGTGGVPTSHLRYLASIGYHVIQIPYANGWFSRVCSGDAFTPECRGNMRLEALTGMDLPTPDRDGNEVKISRADSVESRLPFILAKLVDDDPGGDWGYFLNGADDLYWEAVAVSGGSHGASTSTRFAVHRKLARAVAIVGPRDQLSNWQMLPPATPAYRIFAFSHEDDARWDDPVYPRHYDRSWDLLGMSDYGDIVFVEDEDAPFSLTRQLLTRREVNNPHGCCVIGGSPEENGVPVFQAVFDYIYTHDVTRFQRDL